ncbi:hypothetical protein [Haloferula sargassicola]|uniref:Cox cluster protein n=1 Tax=Haloferula sargassicola TaxID=490096 RepID=A0ABP9UJ71_9BACT
MNSMLFGGLFGSLASLPVLIAYWVGVVAWAKAGRTPGWWCMLIGVMLSTLGMVLAVVSMFLVFPIMAPGPSAPSSFSHLAVWMTVTGGFSGLGSLLFAIGFAIHAFRARRVGDRVTDLETIIAAQNEQLSRQVP